MTKRRMYHGKEKYPGPPNTKKYNKKRVCPTCFNLLSQGGKWKHCPRCGWTNKPPEKPAKRRP